MTIREFESEFKRLYMPLGMYALRIVGDIESAEDIVQEAFAHVWPIVRDGLNVRSFKSYMYTCVRNECLSHLRQRHETTGLDELPEVADSDIDTSERDARIWKAIDSLPTQCREIFLMSKRDGLSNQEIADEMGISIKTVKNQMTKAFSRLREALGSSGKPFFLPFL